MANGARNEIPEVSPFVVSPSIWLRTGLLSWVRELTETPGGEVEPPLPSAKSVETMITVVRQLIDLGHQQVVRQGL